MTPDLLDRYVKEVGRRLPRRTRADVEAELRSLLADSFRDRTAGKAPPDPAALEAEQAALLQSFGPPERTAARYAPPRRYLIGPNLFETYCVTLFAAGTGITLLVLLLLGLSLAAGEGAFMPELLDFAGVYVQWMLTGFGVVTLVFAIVGRLLPEESEAGEEEAAWDPRALPEAEDWTRLDRRGVVFELACLIVGLAALNFFPHWAGWGVPAAEEGLEARWYSVLTLSDVFFRLYLPLWNVDFLLSIVLNLVLLRRGRWEHLSRIAEFLLAVFDIYILASMLAGPPLVLFQGEVFSVMSGLLKAGLAVGIIAALANALAKLPVIFRR
ncbi:MAG: hypothetical protein JW929_04975 [Anaerolineales bacterium]|nr:hypothetical protein [Anaerolineales bacterium]